MKLTTGDARELAVKVLSDIAANGSYNNLALRRALSENGGLPAGARAAVTDTVNGVLRNLIYIDSRIQAASSAPAEKLRPFVLSVLRAAAYELLFTRAPAHAACNEAVNIVKRSRYKDLAGFVNAVLRNISRDAPRGDDRAGPPDPRDPIGRICAEYSCPRWLAEHWLREFDQKTVEDICAESVRTPRVTLCVNTIKTDKAELARSLREEGANVDEDTRLTDSLYISSAGDLSALAAFKAGLFHVMDESAMLAVRLLDPAGGGAVFDVCAAPGGKSFYAAYLTKGACHIRAFDINARRLRLITQTAGRLGLGNIRADLMDARAFDPELAGAADRLILDAPCSGLGLLRKKPDIKYGKGEEDISELAALQRELLANCQAYVRPGGRLLYSTCTISAPENAGNMAWFTANFPFREIEYRARGSDCGKFNYRQPGAGIQILPGPDADGFYICVLERFK